MPDTGPLCPRINNQGVAIFELQHSEEENLTEREIRSKRMLHEIIKYVNYITSLFGHASPAG